MERFDHLLVCTDDLSRDSQVLSFARGLAGAAQTEQIDLLNVLYDFSSSMFLPMHMSVDGVEHIILPTKEDRTEKLQKSMEDAKLLGQEYFGSIEGLKLNAEAIYGDFMTEPLRAAKDRNADILVLSSSFGLPANKGSKALYARRIARRATCSLLVLKDTFPEKIKRILVPVRESDVSQNALETAAFLAERSGAEVVALNVYQLDGGYAYSSASPAEHQALLEDFANRECENLLSRMRPTKASVESICVPDPYDRPVDIIDETAEKIGADLVVIGARGRTGAAGVLLGTITEQLIRKNHLPLLAVKKKGECIGVLDAILSLAGTSNPGSQYG